MNPSDIIEKINSLNKEIDSKIEQLLSDKENPQIMDIDLLNQKLISIYDLTTKLRYQLNLGEVVIPSKETDLEYFHFEPGTSRFMIDPEAPEAKQEDQTITEEVKEPVPEVKFEEIAEDISLETKIETIPIVEQIEEFAAEPEPEAELIPEHEPEPEPEPEPEIIETVEPVFNPIKDLSDTENPIEINVGSEKEASYWTVNSGWIDPTIEKKEPVIVKEKVPIPEPIQNKYIAPEITIKPEPEEKKPIFESISKFERSLNEMISKNNEKSVMNEAQKAAFTDFKSAITLNLKISFIRELFQGNEKEYKKMVDFLNRCENYSEARLYMQGEKEKHPEWLGKQDLLNHLQELINRKFL